MQIATLRSQTRPGRRLGFTVATAAMLLVGFAAVAAPLTHAQERPRRHHGGPALLPTLSTTGQPGERKLTVTNIDSAAVGEFDVQAQDATGRVLWQGHSQGLLGQPEGQATSWIVHTGAFPCGTVNFVADPNDAVSLSDDNNQTVSLTLCPHPDLAVQAVNQGADGVSDHVDFTISNVGEGDAGRFAVQLSGDQGLDTLVQVQSLAAGASATFSVAGRQACELVRVVADPSNSQSDFNQVNNLGVSAAACAQGS
jgi:hypothetical protein